MDIVQPPVPELTPFERTKFECIRNAIYHEDREGFNRRWHKILATIMILLGAFAAGSSLTPENRVATVVTAAVVLAGLINVWWHVDQLARLHTDLRTRSYALLGRLDAGEPVDRVEVDLAGVIAQEPAIMHAVKALAFNSAIDVLGGPPSQKYVLKRWQRLLRHWFAFGQNQFPTEEDFRRSKVI